MIGGPITIGRVSNELYFFDYWVFYLLNIITIFATIFHSLILFFYYYNFLCGIVVWTSQSVLLRPRNTQPCCALILAHLGVQVVT